MKLFVGFLCLIFVVIIQFGDAQVEEIELFLESVPNFLRFGKRSIDPNDFPATPKVPITPKNILRLGKPRINSENNNKVKNLDGEKCGKFTCVPGTCCTGDWCSRC